MVIGFTIGSCHGNSLLYTQMPEKEIPGVQLIFSAHARNLNPKNQIIHYFLVLHTYSGVDNVDTVDNHLKDVHANCFCASLPRTQNSHATSCMRERAK